MERRVVVAEDDAVSAAFLCAVIEPLATVERVGDADALQHALRDRPAQLLILDLQLGRHQGEKLLTDIRECLGDGLPILVVSAELPETRAHALLATGADACLAKPMSADALLKAVLKIAPGLAPAWDDARSDQALGLPESARQQLRQLLLAELPTTRDEVLSRLASGDIRGMRDSLHRLASACGFCGAGALAAAVHRLSARPGTATAQDFAAACSGLLATGAD